MLWSLGRYFSLIHNELPGGEAHDSLHEQEADRRVAVGRVRSLVRRALYQTLPAAVYRNVRKQKLISLMIRRGDGRTGVEAVVEVIMFC